MTEGLLIYSQPLQDSNYLKYYKGKRQREDFFEAAGALQAAQATGQ